MNTNKSRGFTLVELLVISPIIMIVVIGVVTFLFNQFGAITQQSAQLNLRLEAQNILFGMQDDIWYADQFLSTQDTILTDPYAPVGGWKYNTTPKTLIISTVAVTKNRRASDRQPVFINQSTCTPPDGNGLNDAFFNNAIYFVSGTNLYKRILSAPSGLATCGTSYYKQTCPTAHATASCPEDKLLTDHLNTFTITLYDTNNTVITTPENAESVQVDIKLKDTAYANDIFSTNSIRLRKLNQ